MSILIVLIFFKSICLYLQRIVLGCYERFLNPKQKYWLASSSATNQCRGGYRSILSSSSAINKTRALERERLLEQIRARKKTKIRINRKNMAKMCVSKSVSFADEEANNNDSNPLKHGCADLWGWSKRHRSPEVVLGGPANRSVFFHPNWSKGTAGIRGNKILNNGRYYWEIQLSQRVFGTSMMFGIGTKDARLHANVFINLLGEDKNGWGLSHKGLLWHDGVGVRYTKRFKENKETKIGLLFDGINGTLTYYKDSRCLGVAFRGLNEIREPLFPIVCSTAAKTDMALIDMRRDFVNLQDRCRAEISKKITNLDDLVSLNLPAIITNYLAEAMYETAVLSAENNPKLLVPEDNSSSSSSSSSSEALPDEQTEIGRMKFVAWV